VRTYPAVAEEARGETAVLFDEIRRGLGVPVVNLIWRHLATLPDGLAWAWAAVGPFYRSGAAAREGAVLLGALPLPRLPTWSRAALRAAGVDSAAERTVITVLDSYSRTNAMNLVALTALGLRLAGRAGYPTQPAGAPETARAAAPVEGRLPALVAPEDMDARTVEWVSRLDRLGGPDEEQIPASMYRHLAHWPGLLGLAHALVAPLDESGRLGSLVTSGRELARAAAARVAGDLADPGPSPRDATREAVRSALAEFTDTVIAKMTPICALLRRAMPA
jgi:hypothetical protein